MKIVAAGRASPLEAVQRGENARLVPLLGCRDGMSPGRGRDLAGVEDRLAALHGDHRFDSGFHTLLRARLGHLVPALALWVGEKFRAAGANLIGDTHILCMVRDGNPVQRPVLFEALAVVHHDLPARGDPEEVVGGHRHPKHSRVEGVAGVDVGNAPEDAAGEFLVRVSRIIWLLCFHVPLDSVRRRGTLRLRGATAAPGHQREASCQARKDCLNLSCVSSHGWLSSASTRDMAFRSWAQAADRQIGPVCTCTVCLNMAWLQNGGYCT